jgi:agmatine deiminase
MIPDADTNVVYISDRLAIDHPQIEHDLRSILGDPLHTIPGTKDIWCRDYMPVQLDASRYVQFRYRPDYLVGYEHLQTDDAASLLELPNCARSDLVIDGGNVVHHCRTAIVTDKIYKENLGIDRQQLREQLGTILEIDRLVVIPKEPFDRIGHADGMVRFVDEKTLLVNDYSKVDPAFGKRLAAALRGFETIELPYCPTEKEIAGIATAEGVYVNYLQLGGLICVPTYGQSSDDQAFSALSMTFPTNQIVSIRAEDAAKHGGSLHCITWNVQAECSVADSLNRQLKLPINSRESSSSR